VVWEAKRIHLNGRFGNLNMIALLKGD